MRARAPGSRSRGAALILALLVVALVTTLATSAYWLQWRDMEVGAADLERQRSQWILNAALDGGLAVLNDDAREADHLAEPWAAPLPDTRLSSMGALGFASEGEGLHLSRRITDLQGRLNVGDLARYGEVSDAGWAAFTRLFERLDLPLAELTRLKAGLQASMSSAAPGNDAAAALRPVRPDDLRRLGLSASTLERLAPYIAWLPMRTTVNLNTASPEVLYAAIPNLNQASEHKLIQLRSGTPFRSLETVSTSLSAPQGSGPVPQISASLHGVGSRYFEIEIALSKADQTLIERTVVQRDRTGVRLLQRASARQ